MEKILEKLEIYVACLAGIAISVVTIFNEPVPLYEVLFRIAVISIFAYLLGFALKFYIRKIIPKQEVEKEQGDEVKEDNIEVTAIHSNGEDTEVINENISNESSEDDNLDSNFESIENDYNEQTND